MRDFFSASGNLNVKLFLVDEYKYIKILYLSCFFANDFFAFIGTF